MRAALCQSVGWFGVEQNAIGLERSDGVDHVECHPIPSPLVHRAGGQPLGSIGVFDGSVIQGGGRLPVEQSKGSQPLILTTVDPLTDPVAESTGLVITTDYAGGVESAPPHPANILTHLFRTVIHHPRGFNRFHWFLLSERLACPHLELFVVFVGASLVELHLGKKGPSDIQSASYSEIEDTDDGVGQFHLRIAERGAVRVGSVGVTAVGFEGLG